MRRVYYIVSRAIDKIFQDNPTINLGIFVDMDGVIAEYKYGEGTNIKDNVSGVYLEKRPLTSIIDVLRLVSERYNIDTFILSSCLFYE